MKHPTSAELLDHRKEELPPEHAVEIEEHLQVCDSCREEWKALEAMETHLAAWKDEEIPNTLVEDTMRVVDLEETAQSLNRSGSSSRTWRLWSRRAALVAGAIAATLLFQTIVWDPLGEPITFRAIFDLTPTAFALPADQAVPDTVLVLTAHPDETFSTPLLTGQYELDDLVRELTERIEKGTFTRILLLGTDAENPVTVCMKDLQPLLDELGIESINVGEGVVSLEVTEGITARVQVPVRIQSLPLIVTRLDSLRPYVALNLQIGVPIRDSLLAYVVRDSSRAYVVRDSLIRAIKFNPIVLEMTPQRMRLKPGVRIRPSSVRIYVRGDSARTIVGVIEDSVRAIVTATEVRDSVLGVIEATMLDSLHAPARAVLTVTADGIVLMNRAAIPLEEIEEALKRLREQNENITILILIPKGKGEDDPGYELAEIARRVGITSVIVKKVKNP